MDPFWAQSEINHELVEKHMLLQFGDQLIYLVFDRSNSGELTYKKEFFDKIIGTEDFFLWNAELTKAVEFKSIGVLRTGELQH